VLHLHRQQLQLQRQLILMPPQQLRPSESICLAPWHGTVLHLRLHLRQQQERQLQHMQHHLLPR
jgi:hypothetical protein